MSKAKTKEVEAKIGRPIRSMWHRGGRNPRYYDVFLGEPDDTEGDFGWWYPDSERLVLDTIKWKTKGTP